jgi:hypothetical protein
VNWKGGYSIYRIYWISRQPQPLYIPAIKVVGCINFKGVPCATNHAVCISRCLSIVKYTCEHCKQEQHDYVGYYLLNGVQCFVPLEDENHALFISSMDIWKCRLFRARIWFGFRTAIMDSIRVTFIDGRANFCILLPFNSPTPKQHKTTPGISFVK